jgi:hypothetical protein
MTFPIEDQLIKGYILGKASGEFTPDMLISEMVFNTILYGISYKDGILDVKNLSGEFTEAYVDNGILKVK